MTAAPRSISSSPSTGDGNSCGRASVPPSRRAFRRTSSWWTTCHPTTRRDQISAEFPDVTLLRNEVNLGFARTCNVGMAAGDGRLVMLVNSDVVLQPDAVAAALGALPDDPASHVGSAATLLLAPDGTVDSYGIVADVTGAGFVRFHGAELSKADAEHPPVLGPYGAVAVYRRAALDEVGLFDTNIFMYGEELDLAFRLRAAGWSCVAMPEPSGMHLGGASAGRESARQRRLSGFARGYLLRKYGVAALALGAASAPRRGDRHRRASRPAPRCRIARRPMGRVAEGRTGTARHAAPRRGRFLDRSSPLAAHARRGVLGRAGLTSRHLPNLRRADGRTDVRPDAGSVQRKRTSAGTDPRESERPCTVNSAPCVNAWEVDSLMPWRLGVDPVAARVEVRTVDIDLDRHRLSLAERWHGRAQHARVRGEGQDPEAVSMLKPRAHSSSRRRPRTVTATRNDSTV